MKKVIASAGLVALGTVGVQTAHSQWAAGPEKPWSIAGTLRGFYDDNINTQPDGPGRVSSTGFELRPSGTLIYQNGPTTYNTSLTYAMLYYTEREPNKIDQDVDWETWLTHAFNERYSVDFRNSFVVAQEPDVLSPGSQSLYLRANGSNIRNTGNLNFHDQITPLFGIVLGYYNTVYAYSEDASKNVTPGSPPFSTLLNRLEQTFKLDTTWQIQPQLTGVLGYSFLWIDYIGGGNTLPAGATILPGFPSYAPSTVNNNNSDTFYVGADDNLRSDLTASVRVGASYTDYYNTLPDNPRNTFSPYANISLTYRYMDGGSLVFGFVNSRNQTDIPAQVVVVNGVQEIKLTQDQESATVYANVVQRLTPVSPNLTATLTAQYQNATYHGGSSLNNTTDNIYLLGLNLSYQFNHYLSSEVGYNYDDIVSSVPGLPYSRNRVYIGVTASY